MEINCMISHIALVMSLKGPKHCITKCSTNKKVSGERI